MNVELVKYLCSCDKKVPICRSYFCKHCLKSRCIDCVQHEVDTPYCPNCLESMPHGEAKLKKNRCSNCFDCPVCGHTLNTRATTNTTPSPDDPTKMVTKKMYYMACGFCRWTTRDVNLPDQTTATGNWPELENPNSKRITSLLENYRIIAQMEKAERERKKYVKRRSHLYLQEKYGLPSASKRKGLSNMSSHRITDDEKLADIKPSATVDSFAALPEEIFTQPAPLDKLTKLSNRLKVPEFQPEVTGKLHIIHKHLLMRKSLRCRECEHNLIKADFNPISIKFKIHLTALNHVPELRIFAPYTFTYNKETAVTLTLSNPSSFNMSVTLAPLEGETDTDYCTAKIDLPKKEILLAGRDEPSMHMIDESSQAHDFKDDSKVIAFRKANKVGVITKVTPTVKEGEVKVGFMLKHEFRNTAVAALQSEVKEPEIVWIAHKVYLTLGRV